MNSTDIADALGLETHQARTALAHALTNLQVFDRKQKDYGPYNIASNPCPELGVAIRCNDKVQRLMNLLYDNKEPNVESKNDSWLDLANYAYIGLMTSNGEWLGEGE